MKKKQNNIIVTLLDKLFGELVRKVSPARRWSNRVYPVSVELFRLDPGSVPHKGLKVVVAGVIVAKAAF